MSNTHINLDASFLSPLNLEKGHNELFWSDDIEFILDRDFICGMYNAKNYVFMPDSKRNLSDFPTDIIKFTSKKGAPGWFYMSEPTEQEISDFL